MTEKRQTGCRHDEMLEKIEDSNNTINWSTKKWIGNKAVYTCIFTHSQKFAIKESAALTNTCAITNIYFIMFFKYIVILVVLNHSSNNVTCNNTPPNPHYCMQFPTYLFPTFSQSFFPYHLIRILIITKKKYWQHKCSHHNHPCNWHNYNKYQFHDYDIIIVT